MNVPSGPVNGEIQLNVRVSVSSVPVSVVEARTPHDRASLQVPEIIQLGQPPSQTLAVQRKLADIATNGGELQVNCRVVPSAVPVSGVVASVHARESLQLRVHTGQLLLFQLPKASHMRLVSAPAKPISHV